MVDGHSNRFFKNLLKGRYHALVKSGAALKKDAVSDTSISDNSIEVVFHDGIAETGHEIDRRGPTLLVMDEVGLDENCAPLSHANRFF